MKEILGTFRNYLKTRFKNQSPRPPKVLILLKASLIFEEMHMVWKYLFFEDAFTKINTFGGSEGLFQERFFKYLVNVLSISFTFEAHGI